MVWIRPVRDWHRPFFPAESIPRVELGGGGFALRYRRSRCTVPALLPVWWTEEQSPPRPVVGANDPGTLLNAADIEFDVPRRLAADVGAYVGILLLADGRGNAGRSVVKKAPRRGAPFGG